MKVCSRCKIEKPLDDFYPRSDRKNRKVSKCKSCSKTYATERSNSNKESWKKWLEEMYGKTPACEICQQPLGYFKRTKCVDYVCFDHKTDSKLIPYSPSDWMAKNLCTEKNRQFFSLSNFGILCLSCNARLGTPEYRQKIRAYLEKGE